MGRQRVDYPRRITRRLKNGTLRDYFYDRVTGKPIAPADLQLPLPTRKPRAGARWGVTVGSEMALEKLIAQFQASPEWTNLAPATQELYDRTLHRGHLEPLWRLKVNELTRERVALIRAAIAESGLERWGKHSTGAANIFLQALGSLYAWGRQNRGIGELYPTRGIKNYPIQHGHMPWTDRDIEAFLKRMPEPLTRAIRLALATAARLGDLIRLTWHDWDGRALKIAPMKTKRFRQQLIIPLGAPWPERFATWRAEASAVTILTREGGTSWPDVQTFCRRFGDARKAAQLPADRSMHGLRATAATRLIELGMSTRSVMALTGHTSEKSFQAYIRYADQQILVVPAAEALGQLSRRF